MTDIGEGVSVEVSKEEKPEKGGLIISVRDICTGERIPEAEIKVGTEAKTGDDQGEAEFSDLSVGAVNVKVKKHFKDADYITFLVHKIPFSKKSISRLHKAKSSAQEIKIVVKDKTSKKRIEIPVYRIEDGVRFCRKDLKIQGSIDYGHWWIEIGSKSYGWWPVDDGLDAKELPEPVEPPPLSFDAGAKEKISHLVARASYRAQRARYDANDTQASYLTQAIYKTFTGVPGTLNADEMHKNSEQDPYHGQWKKGKTDEDYHPVIVDCRTQEEIYKAIRNFALYYSGEWSWVFEGGKNCHSFQIEAMSKLDLERVKKL